MMPDDVKTVDAYARLICFGCNSKGRVVYLNLTECKRQIEDSSENRWICPVCKSTDNEFDYNYFQRILVQ